MNHNILKVRVNPIKHILKVRVNPIKQINEKKIPIPFCTFAKKPY